ncbi:hypothetical protein [Dactylosporangium matsuzakiense]|uniref:Uncharacterized protein n=1 Tax=Dactylosporangium matsuzakiense TaxID=53360 RepID=A0A9W6KWL3_9ACTN|nr:hypothetical protein [Dactylosporangium matsuzakiense]UWZ47829.1 hypothetical protein Dmats_16345 [Dactylosporangium matsuzakiense]GLL08658.1 hypothetical protein GCM10017581_104250 [Dactylosporangium matsuzakiense]
MRLLIGMSASRRASLCTAAGGSRIAAAPLMPADDMVLDASVIDWQSVRDVSGDSGVRIGRLLDVERYPTTEAWDEIERRLVVEAECWCSAGFAALPRLAELAQSGTEEHQIRALRLAATIVRSLHRSYQYDDIVRAGTEALKALHRLARNRPTVHTGRAFVAHLQYTLAFAGFTFWATISLDFTDEHYHLGCPHCAVRLAVVIGDFGHYTAIRDYNDGDIHRVVLRPVTPGDLTGIGRWMYDAAGETVLADGLTYLFGRATCSICGSAFNVAEWLEAENSPTQPIDTVVPRTDRST